MSDRNLEQRTVIKLLVKNGKNPTDTLQHLRTAFGELAMKKTSVFEWHKRFKDGRENVRDDSRSGQPRTQRTEENVKRVRDLVREKEGLSVRGIAEELGLNRETVRKILNEELGVKRRSKTDNDAPEPGCSIWLVKNDDDEDMYSENDVETFEPEKEPEKSIQSTSGSELRKDEEVAETKKRPAESSVLKRKRILVQEEPVAKQRTAEFEAFAKSIVTQLSSMPYLDAIRLQLKIQMLVTEEKLKSLEKTKNEKPVSDSTDFHIIKPEINIEDNGLETRINETFVIKEEP